VILLAIATVLTVALWLVYRKTKFGIATFGTTTGTPCASGSLGLGSERLRTAEFPRPTDVSCRR